MRLLGGVSVSLGAAPLAPLESARARSLLGYVLLHSGTAVPRQHLAFLLWPDSSEAQARTNLRKVLHTLRREMPEIDRFLDVTPRTLRWTRDAGQWVDVERFEAALSAADQPEPSSEQVVLALREATALYEGELLDGCYDDWLIEERERLRDRYISALRRLVSLLADRCDPDAVRLGRELVRSEPLHEDSHRLLMRAHDAAGDRAAAVRAYHACAATLDRELGVAPSAETRRVYEALTERQEARDPVGPPVRVTGPVLIGRDGEIAQLTRYWQETEAGRTQLVVVSGEPGIGKTRLIDELSSACTRRGALVAHARAYQSEGEVGFGVVASWLRAVPAQLRQAPPADQAELSLLLPELFALPGDSALSGDPAEQRRRLFDAVARTLLPDDRPTLLVADDAQWCDEASLQLIHYLVRLDPDRRLLVAATVRREEVEDLHPFSALVASLDALGRTGEISLDRLDRAATAALARAVSDAELDDQFADALHAETEGNPLFVVETVRAGGGASWPASTLTPRLKGVIGTRLRQLSPPTSELVGIAAAIGREFTTELVRAASPLDELGLVQALDELWRRGLIREQGSDAYDFSHGKIRDVAYETLSPAACRHVHARVAAALRGVNHTSLDAVSGQVAAHYDRAGATSEAIEWYRRAAAEAQRLHADTDAVRLLERALALTSTLPAEDRMITELAVVSALPTALVGVDGFASDRVDAAQRRALEASRAVGAPPALPLLRSLVMSRLCRHDFAGALTAAEELRGVAERSADTGLLVEADYLTGITSFWTVQLEQARASFQRVADEFDARQRTDHLRRFGHDPAVVCMTRLANTLWFLGRPDEARTVRDEALALAFDVGHPYSRGAALAFAALVSIDLDDVPSVGRCLDALGREEHLSRPVAIFSRSFEGFVDALDGQPARGIERICAAIDDCGPIDLAPGTHAALRRVLLAAHALNDQPDAGLAAADEALAAPGSRLWEPEIRRLRAEFLATSDAGPEEVEEELAAATGVAHRQGARGPERRIAETRSRLGIST